MRIAGSNRCFLNPAEEKTLARMAKDGSVAVDIEEGEISGGSVEEISEDDFKQQESKSVVEISEEDFRQESSVSKLRADSKAWMNYPSNYPQCSLHNLAWISGVRNTPLNEILVRGFDSGELRPTRSVPGNSGLNVEKDSLVIDVSADDDDMGEKEEGELEEGEIDLDSDAVEVKESEEGNPPDTSNITNDSETEGEFAKCINSISEDLKNLTAKEAEKLFVLIKDQDPALFPPEQMKEMETKIRSVISDSGLFGIKPNDKEKDIQTLNEGNFSDPGILSGTPANGLSSLKKLNLEAIQVNSTVGRNGKGGAGTMKLEMPFTYSARGGFTPLIDPHAEYDESSLPSPTREDLPPLSTREDSPPLPKQKSEGAVDAVILSATTRQEETEDAALHPCDMSDFSNYYNRTTILLSNRLPSPTPSEESHDDDGDSHGEVNSSAVGISKSATSSTQLQSFVSTSGFTSGLSGQGLVPLKAVAQLGSSSPASSLNPSTSFQPPTTSVHVDTLSKQGPVPGKTVTQLGLPSERILKVPMKSRDPRLRHANPDSSAFDINRRPLSDNSLPKNEQLGGSTSSRKHRSVEEAVDVHLLKKPRNGLMDSGGSREANMASGKGGRLAESWVHASQPSDKERMAENMEIDVRKSENGVFSDKLLHASASFNGASGGSQQPAVATAAPAVSLPSLLRDLAVNPTMLMNLLKIEKERLAAEARQKSTDLPQPAMLNSSPNMLPGPVSSGNASTLKAPEGDQRLPGKPQNQPQTASAIDRGKVRMKPRDPRRILHNNMVQKNENSGCDQSKTTAPIPSSIQGRKDNVTVREQAEEAVTSSLSQHSSLPDIAPQFTDKLKNIAAIMSGSQMTSSITSPTVSQIVSQPMLPKTDKVDLKVPLDSDHQQTATSTACEESLTSLPPNTWGGLEHLFEGCDDHQRAALQKERARRLAEQNKMFAARKLCLVLDLDHTLLNSAKFSEVDLVHDEILRKKEELDREKTQRHLFRFQHMGMWTKLRPGIWNFLEKASKLYELHLYTMGNKFYATEMAKVLDPTGTLFAGRVLSRGDDGEPFDGDERVPKSKDLDGVLGMESAVVIIDDSVRVWPHNKLNLIVVERYTYFPYSRRQFGLLGPSLLEIDHDERPEDGTLASSLAVIERIHQFFFSHQCLNDLDVRNILASEQRKILAGCRIVFSRVFPVGEANPHLHPLWQTAEQFGAVCTNQIDDQVTHVVANSLGTDKYDLGLTCLNRVEASALLYRRANERDFAVKI
ncbi:hypothetical protein ACLOJK_002202 [Asimina triloba]